MSLRGCIAAPTIEAVIQHHRRIELREVIAIHARQSKRYCQETAGLRGKIEAGSIGTTNDNSQTIECFGVQAEFIQHYIERAEFGTVAPENPLHVEWGRSEAFRYGENLGRRDIKKDRRWVYEAAYQPGAGDPVNFGATTGHPGRASAGVSCWQVVRLQQHGACRAPCFKTPFEAFRIGALMAQPSRDTLTKLEATLADNDNGPPLEVPSPLGRRGPIPAEGRR